MAGQEKFKDKIRVGILRGGIAEDYNSSIARGGEIILYILENLSPKYKPFDILVDQNGLWHLNGVPILPEKLLYKVDVVWNTSHPSFSNILESFSIPHIGFSPFSPPVWSSKEILRKHMKKIGVQMPRHILSPKNAKEVFEKFSSPWVVNGKLIKTFPELIQVIDGRQDILVEEFISDKVASVHSVSNFRNQAIYVFPVAGFIAKEKEKLISLAHILHEYIGAKPYLRSDFVLHPRGGIYLTNINLNPDLKPDSHFNKICESVGAKMHHVVEHILEKALF